MSTDNAPAMTPPPLSLYVHIPWCVRKCPYCDFNSHAAGEPLPERPYVDALLADLETDRRAAAGREVISVFIGGGTPSLFSSEAIARLLDGIRARVPLAAGAEITLEANPGTLERGKYGEFRAAGVNRLSIGVQSFDDTLLGRLGRIHSGREAARAAEAAHDAGFDNFNLDLMFGLPGQVPSQALRDLRSAMDLEPTHLSWYQLTVEPNTLFWHQRPSLPDDETVWAMQRAGQSLLARRGFGQYEVSAYAKDGRRCRHNLNYWEFGDYLGIGAGAHGKHTDPARRRVSRRWKHRHPRDYQERAATGAAVAGEQRLEDSDLILEFMMNGLRLTNGVAEATFEPRTGIPLRRIEALLARAPTQELLQHAGGRLQPTALGRRFLNDLVALFAAESA
ncbi:MAG: radical SAM family heme chaperone HemW [Gammaproteobacteria bacterium]